LHFYSFHEINTHFFNTFSVFMRTNDPQPHLLSTDYLVAFREHGIFRFHPETTIELPPNQPIAKASLRSIRSKVQTHLRLPFWPDTNDTCSISPSDMPTNFFGLGINPTVPTIPDCLSLEESKCILLV
jgi:hypothetical protein